MPALSYQHGGLERERQLIFTLIYARNAISIYLWTSYNKLTGGLVPSIGIASDTWGSV